MTRKQSRRPATEWIDHGGLIQPAAMIERPLPRPFLLDARLRFEERVERAWARLKAEFEEGEHERLREALVEVITKEVDDEQKR